MELQPPGPPPVGPPAWPPPPPDAWSAPARANVYRRRRWPMVAMVIGGLLVAALGVAAGAAGTTSSAASQAAALAAAGDYGGAIAIDQAIQARRGPLFILDLSASATATRAEQETRLQWAASLGRAGKIDQAVALYRSVTGPLRIDATAALALLLYRAASSEATRSAFPSAILRLQQIVRLAPGTVTASQARQQLPIDMDSEARQLIASGHAVAAVALLDQVVQQGSAPATGTANSLYPAALLIAGQEELAQQSAKEAVVDLQRLVARFPGTAQALQATAMLSAPVSVSGTLVQRSGAPTSAPVRLSTHYTAEPDGTYKTGGPFYFASADAMGDFTFTGVPVGGPYVLEVFSGGNWTTLVDPSTGAPVDPVKVTALVPVDLTFVVLPS